MSQRSDYNVNINLTTKDHTSRPTRSAMQSFVALTDKVQELGAAFGVIQKYAQKGLDFVKLGAQTQRTGAAFDSLAKAAGTTGDAIIGAIGSASNFTIDKMSAMQIANKALVMDVARTPEQFSELTEVATALGRAMGQDATKSIEDFIVASGRQSKLIADNLGLVVSAEDAYRRYAEENNVVIEQMDDAAKKQAFLNEMLRQGRIKMGELGDQGGDLQEQIEQIETAVKDLNTELAQMVAERFEATLEGFSSKAYTFSQLLRDLPVVVRGLGNAWDYYLTRVLEDGQGGAWAWALALKQVREEMDRTSLAAALAADAANTWQQDEDELRKVIVAVAEDTHDAAIETTAYAKGIGGLDAATPRAVENVEELAKALKEQAEAAEETRIALRKFSSDLGMDFTAYYDDVEKAAEDFADKREEIEAEHITKMQTIRKKGWSTAIKVDEAAEWDKLALMEERLEIALQSQAEFTEKTKESTRMAKDLQIRQLQDQIASQKQLLDDFYAGRLVKQGQNISGLLAAEQERYTSEIEMLEASRIEQEAAQRESLGRMILNEFTAWAELKEIPPDALIDMRLDIMEEYGLIDSAGRKAASDMVVMWNKAVNDFGGDMQRAMDWWDELEERRAKYIANLEKAAAKTYDIRVRILQQKLGIEEPEGANTGMAFGGSFIAGPGFGGPRWVGEGGRPERVTVQPLIDQSVGTMNVYDGQAMALYNAQRAQMSMRAFERSSI